MSEADNQTTEKQMPVVGIGASAGGIKALQEFFDVLPPRLGVAIVVVVHLAPFHASELANILAKHTSMRVVQVEQRLPLEPDTVYVIAPNRQLLISDSSIDCKPFAEARGQRAPIDHFLCSLAKQHGDGFAIILSGGGSDGANGVKAVRENGGLILVQDPSEAEQGSMPRNAIATGADFVLPVREIATQLADLIRTKAYLQTTSLEDGDAEIIRKILDHVLSTTGQDFSKYKRPTILRRIARRMQVTHCLAMEDYLDVLTKSGDEPQALMQDLLISVTSFFRDASVFEAFSNQAIVPIFDALEGNKPIRAWVAGCATGEEAYTIAILLIEESLRREIRPEIQVFATDVDEQALAIARDGRYPTSIEGVVSDDRLSAHFIRDGERYRVKREVRDLVVFARHNILRDPPFSRVQLVSCRNLLIYLDRDAQKQVCTVLHYALQPDGYWLLGSSESADLPPGLFKQIDREARIVQAVGRTMRTSIPVPVANDVSIPPAPITALSNHQEHPEVTPLEHRDVLESLSPPSMLVGKTRTILNLSDTAGRFLLHSSGPITVDAADIVRPELRVELKAALYHALEQQLPTVSFPIIVNLDGALKYVVMHVRPVVQDGKTSGALVLFMEGGSIDPATVANLPEGEPASLIAKLRDELAATRSTLQTTREQYDSATEELRAANEELQSINEEYRSTAEELETSKEELQSINEELQTLNTELKVKLDQVSRGHNDLQNLMSATDVSTMFLDTSLRIQRFTPLVAELFNIQPGDEGRPISDFTHRLDYQDLLKDAERVLADLIPIERTVSTKNDRWYLLRLRPYRTADNRIDGVVAAFVDVTEHRRTEAAWDARQKMLLGELSHRVKNSLSVVQAVSRLTLADRVPIEVLERLEHRIAALGSAHDILIKNDWRGAGFEALARQQLAAYVDDSNRQLSFSGPAVILPPEIATPLALVLHELATNAAKYGAFQLPTGQVVLTWEIRDVDGGVRLLDLSWTEKGGPPVSPPTHKGSGSTLIDRGLARSEVQKWYLPEGFVCRIKVPLSPASA